MADIAALARTVPVVTVATRATALPIRLRRRRQPRRHRARWSTTSSCVHGYRDLDLRRRSARSPDSMERFDGYRDAMRSHDFATTESPDAKGAFTASGGGKAVAAC